MKAILVLQYKPNFCADCPLFTWNDEKDTENEMGECRFWGEVNGGELHHRCPIKPMPQKMRTDEDDIEEDSYCQGWNECLEELEK